MSFFVDMQTLQMDLRDFPADVQDVLKERAIRDRRPIGEVVRDFALEMAAAIRAAAGEDEDAA